MTKRAFIKVGKMLNGHSLSFLKRTPELFFLPQLSEPAETETRISRYNHKGGTFTKKSFKSISLHVAVTLVPFRGVFNRCTVHLGSSHSVWSRLPGE